MEPQSMDDLQSAVTVLSAGLEALCSEFTTLFSKQDALERKLKATTEECNTLRRLYPEATVESISSVAQSHNPDEANPRRSIEDIFTTLRRQGADAASLNAIQTAMKAGRRWRDPMKEKVEEKEKQITETAPRCPFATMAGTRPADHAKISDDGVGESSFREGLGKRSERVSFHDPLETEPPIAPAHHSEVTSTASGPACPIRFLDQHSAEDIAKYFEEHKHELPRSHEVCVKRFQANADSIRELDAKYGNLVAMIQGLGHKHQPMLHAGPGSEPVAGPSRANVGEPQIQSWAKAISDQAVIEDYDQEHRVGHFDRPLKDIRVGESPSRPWGVPIPLKYLDAADRDLYMPENETKPVSNDEHPPDKVAPLGVLPSTPFQPADPTQQMDDDICASGEGNTKITSGKGAVVNHGNAFIGTKDIVNGFEIVNHGTLFLGVDVDKAGVRDIMAQLLQAGETHCRDGVE